MAQKMAEEPTDETSLIPSAGQGTLTNQSVPPDIILNAAGADQIQDALQRYSEMRVLLVGKSGAGKSSFVNCLFQANKARVGRVKPETSEVTEYTMHLTNVGVSIKVYDTPGFGSNKKENMKYIKEIRKRCELVDVIFLCIRMDDQLRAEDQETITLLAKEFKPNFWTKTLVVFTRANMVQRMGQHKDEYDTERSYLKAVRDDLKDIVMDAFKKAKTTAPSFVIAGAPEFIPDKRKIPCVDDSDPEQIDWLPAVAAKLFESGCSDNGKAVLLKSGWGKWASASAGTGAGTVVGTAIGAGILAAGVATLPVPPVGVISIAIGGTVILVSLAIGGTSSVTCGTKAADKRSKKEKRVKDLESELKKASPPPEQ